MTSMLSQIFKYEIPDDFLFDFLEKICEKTDSYYLVDIACYKKIYLLDLKQSFIDSLKEYYYLSKRFYLERDFTYPSFTNIIRQICKHKMIDYESKISYSHSDYSIVYYIYY
jgi:hypothetical protein